MRVIQVEIRYGRRFNLGAYNSLNAEISLMAELNGEEDLESCVEELWDKAREQVKTQIMRIMDLEKGKEAAEASFCNP